MDFTGRTEAVEAINIVPRVTGYLSAYRLRRDPRSKPATVSFGDRRPAIQGPFRPSRGPGQAVPGSTLVGENDLARDLEIPRRPGAVAAQQLDQDRAAVDEAEARVKAYQASTEVYKLNLSFTKVTSPIDGQVSRYFLANGNLVNQDQTLLTTVVSLDPIWAYFDMDEPTCNT